MAEISDLVPFIVGPQWGAWEPMALSMMLTGGMAMVAAALSARQASNHARTYLFALVCACALACGLLGVFVPLEQPSRVWEFLAHPALTSWTAWGAYLVPLCLVCALILLRRTRNGSVAPRPLFLTGLAAGGLVLAYATGELRACLGRGLWASPWMTPVLLMAGATGAVGLALLLGLRLPGGPGPRRAFGERLSPWGLALSFACALLALLVRAPQGFAPYVGVWWHAPEALMVLMGICALAARGQGSLATTVRGVAAVLASVILLWKIIHMAEIFGRNASLYPAGLAFADLFSAEALAALAGTAGLMIVLAVALPLLWPPASKA